MEFRDYYETLGLSRTASDDEIKRAYRRLARKYHPDVSTEADAEMRFKEMKEAYEVLKDPEKRAAYDKFGENWEAGQDFQPPPDWAHEFNSAGGGGFEGGEHFSDFFETLFGGARGGFGTGNGTRGGFRDLRMDGEDINARITISVEDAFAGATRQISLNVPQVTPDGHRGYQTRKLNVTIPKGIKPGQRIRLEGQGSPGIGSGANSGDLFLQVDFEPHPTFEISGRDVHVKLPISPSEAVLGAKVKAPTLGGVVDLTVPPGSNSGKRLRLKGRGLPGGTPGDQYVELVITVPSKPSAAERALYEKLKQESDFDPRENMGAGL